MPKLTNRIVLSRIALALSTTLVVSAPLGVPAFAAPACSPTVTPVSGATVLIFGDIGTCDWVVPSNVTTLTQVLIVGGGGGGGHDIGGGGGGGGVIELSNVSVTPGATIPVTVGGGGVGNTGYATNPASNGQDSVFLSNTAVGGGAGGSGGETGKNGGSGGGGGYGAHSRSPVGGNSTQSAPGLGNSGGGSFANFSSGAGGGGAGGVGQNTGSGGNTEQGGNGGAGISSTITGTLRFYAGGGGGGSQPAGSGTTGGSGVGGNGGRVSPEILTGAGAPNTGSGGGGAGSGSTPAVKNGGAGGSGVVIVRFASESSAPDTAEDVGPPDWYQSIARRDSSSSCEIGWSPSWAHWPNAGLGGWVCNRIVYWNAADGTWLSRAG